MKIQLIFSNGAQGVHQGALPDAASWREAAAIARRELARFGAVRREHNMPGGTDRMWVAPGNRAVHGKEIAS